jgi:hypothetical protein
VTTNANDYTGAVSVMSTHLRRDGLLAVQSKKAISKIDRVIGLLSTAPPEYFFCGKFQHRGFRLADAMYNCEFYTVGTLEGGESH